MSDENLRPIVVKRIKKAAHGHHGGAWKIAYADFVTAMMAFFLLMWLLGSTTKAQKKGISEYFQTPMKVALMGGNGSGAATSLTKGGGDDLTKDVGQDNETGGASTAAAHAQPNLDQAAAALEQVENERLELLKEQLKAAIEANPKLADFKDQILIDLTPEGLRIQIVDKQGRPMFSSGSAAMQPYAREILRAIGEFLNDVPNAISLSGHTDAKAYAGGNRGYSNWELSADRSNASRRELMAGGIADDKIIRVVGLAGSQHLDTKNPLNPMNRRISVIVLKKKAEEAIRGTDEPAVNVESKEDAAATQLGEPPVTAAKADVRQDAPPPAKLTPTPARAPVPAPSHNEPPRSRAPSSLSGSGAMPSPIVIPSPISLPGK